MRLLLLPISLLYGIAVFIRNLLYGLNIYTSRKYPVPIICIGNLSTGGTGKTPHTELLIKLLSENYKLATLSRGYKRKTSGFIVANNNHTVEDIGDEPKQYFDKFKKVKVVVDENRRRAIKNIINNHPDIDLIIMDDGFQHRKVKPGFSILLTDYHKLYTKDYLLPAGNLREFRSGSKRADTIIVTKTPKVFSPILKRDLIDKIKPGNKQDLFFSYISYGNLKLMKGIKCSNLPKKLYSILLFTGIANPVPIEEYLKRKCEELTTLTFPDHYQYTIKDLDNLKESFRNIVSKNKIIVTTEKDAMRLQDEGLLKTIEGLPVYYLPIEVKIHKDDRDAFQKLIMDYVEKATRDYRIYKEKNRD